ncbi:hypothetical protein ILUMI_21226 [Ignelater luminosus]|uniref:Major facilitator superfamily (MFS) profile domain-containing protein n=1 Tax=Ignelater luminosus TaxID=2038154 RepID=A0A8K0CCU9_IGNLU|nr:hypothetical protein ILUMI_21226 [Ignelater luminosus]
MQNPFAKCCVKSTEGNNSLQFLAMFTGTLSLVCSGMHYGWPSPSLPQLLNNSSTILITSEEGSWIAVMPLIGSICGSLISVLILDVIGRKRAILLSCIPHLVAWIMIAYAKSVAVIISARFIAGISDGLVLCALPMYLGEIANARVRGALGSSVSVMRIFGTFLINIIGSYLSISTTAIVSSILPLLCLFTFAWMPESPYYLIMKENVQQAGRNLKMLRCTDNVEADLERMAKAVKEQNENTKRYLDLFTVKANRKALGIALVLRGAQQISGISAITFYAQIIFAQAGNISILSARHASMIYFAVQVILCACCSMIVDKVGRRPLLIISIVGAGLALFTGGTYFYVLNKSNANLNNFAWIPLVALVGYVVFFSLGMQTIPITILGEMFPTNVKAFALSLMAVYFCITATIVSKFFQITKDNFGLHVPFYTFFMVCVLGLIFIILFVPETKGKTLEEIQDELKQCDVKGNKTCTEPAEECRMLPDSYTREY